jgi:hypothetical protein
MPGRVTEVNMTKPNRLLLCLSIAAALTLATGCQEKAPTDKAVEAPKEAAEKTAEAFRDTVKKAEEGAEKALDKAKDAVKDGTEAAKEGVKKAGDAVKQGVEKTGEALEKAGEKIKSLGK